MEAVWTDYAAAKPAPESVCEWRMPHSTLEGVVVVVIAKMRQRGAGYSNTYSPPFDYWDGYRLHVPKGLQWRALAEPKALKSYGVELVGIEGLTHCECIYCGKVPKLKGYHRHPSGGLVVSPVPSDLNSWSLECCGWGKTPDFADPRKLEEARRAAFARAAQPAPAQPSAEQGEPKRKILPEPGSTKPEILLYTDAINGEQVSRDDLWIVATEVVNRAASADQVRDAALAECEAICNNVHDQYHAQRLIRELRASGEKGADRG